MLPGAGACSPSVTWGTPLPLQTVPSGVSGHTGLPCGGPGTPRPTWAPVPQQPKRSAGLLASLQPTRVSCPHRATQSPWVEEGGPGAAGAGRRAPGRRPVQGRWWGGGGGFCCVCVVLWAPGLSGPVRKGLGVGPRGRKGAGSCVREGRGLPGGSSCGCCLSPETSAPPGFRLCRGVCRSGGSGGSAGHPVGLLAPGRQAGLWGAAGSTSGPWC